MMFRQTRFREVEQIRAYDFESLVGNVGGYIGMFLGYAISNLPRFFLDIIMFTKNISIDLRYECNKLTPNITCSQHRCTDDYDIENII